MTRQRKTKSEWMRFAEAARVLRVARNTIAYRCGLRQYATHFDASTGVTLVSRKDIERAKREAEKQLAAIGAA